MKNDEIPNLSVEGFNPGLKFPRQNDWEIPEGIVAAIGGDCCMVVVVDTSGHAHYFKKPGSSFSEVGENVA